jgi:SnoaL-like domain
MIFPNIHWAARIFLAAAAARQHATLACVSRADLTVTFDGVTYQDTATWLAALLPGQTLHILPVNASAQGAASVVAVIVSASYGADAERAAFRMEWRFTVRDERIAAVHIGPAAPLQIPAAVLAYIHAANNSDLDALLSTFADDGLVNDQLRDYWGKDAIAEWAARDLVGDRVTMAIVKIVEHYGQVVITAHVDGNYDKHGLPEPLVLAFYFSVRGDKIVQLIILRNIAHL